MVTIVTTMANDGIGFRVKELRESRRWTQGQLSERSGLARSYITRLEQGERNPKRETLEKLARAFSVPISVLEEPPGTDVPPLDKVPELLEFEVMYLGAKERNPGRAGRLLEIARDLFAVVLEEEQSGAEASYVSVQPGDRQRGAVALAMFHGLSEDNRVVISEMMSRMSKGEEITSLDETSGGRIDWPGAEPSELTTAEVSDSGGDVKEDSAKDVG